MKIKIGPYKDWIGPYQIADLIVFWDDEKAHNFGRFLATGSFKESTSNKLFDRDEHKTWLYRLCEWIHSKQSRKVKIHIDDYDIWNTDATLAIIILPMLKKIKEDKHGTPWIHDEDVPEELRSDKAPPKRYDYDWDTNNDRRWHWVLDEMIWSFEQLQPDYDWEDQYHKGKIEFVKHPLENGMNALTRGPGDTHQFDRKGYMEHNDRIQRGLILFGKYFRSLWT